jgi:hypothetical protein
MNSCDCCAAGDVTKLFTLIRSCATGLSVYKRNEPRKLIFLSLYFTFPSSPCACLSTEKLLASHHCACRYSQGLTVEVPHVLVLVRLL